MSPIFAIIVAVVAGVLAYGIWNVLNTHSAANSRRKRQRKSDRVVLTRQQKKVYQEAIRYYKKGNLVASARMLESLNMTREAINLLEKGRHVHEAAAILLRIHRPNRAGIIYARHKMWKEAAECFKKANLPEEVAKCSKKAGDLATAVVYFMEAKKYQAAAECYEELGKHRDAAKIYTKLGHHQKAIQQYKYLLDKNPHIESIEFSDKEVDVIVNYIASESTDTRLADVLVIKNRIVEVLCRLIKKGRIDKARKIYQKSTSDIGPALIGYNDFTPEDHERLAELFTNSTAYEYAGMVYERLEMFGKAGDAFKLQEDFERAAYCYDRANLPDKVTEMRIEIASRGPSPQVPPTPKHPQQTENENPFKIEITSAEGINTPQIPENDTIPLPELAAFGQSPEKIDLGDIGEVGDLEDIEKTDMSSFDSENTAEVPAHPDQFSLSSDDDSIDWTGFHDAKFLQDLTTEQQNALKNVGTIKYFQENDVILDYKDEPVGLYFILDGEIEVRKLMDGVDTMIDTMRPPETIGKLWLLMDRPSNVKFIAMEQATLFAIKRGDFMDILDKDGTIARKIYKRFTMSLLEKLVNSDNYSDNLEAS